MSNRLLELVTMPLVSLNCLKDYFSSMEENAVEEMQILFCITSSKTSYWSCQYSGLDSIWHFRAKESMRTGFTPSLTSSSLLGLLSFMDSLTRSTTTLLWWSIRSCMRRVPGTNISDQEDSGFGSWMLFGSLVLLDLLQFTIWNTLQSPNQEKWWISGVQELLFWEFVSW